MIHDKNMIIDELNKFGVINKKDYSKMSVEQLRLLLGIYKIMSDKADKALRE